MLLENLYKQNEWLGIEIYTNTQTAPDTNQMNFLVKFNL